jgi:hypothetical protein
MDVPDDIDCYVLVYIDRHEALLLHELVVCSDYNFPCVPPRECLPILKPLDHRPNKFYSDLVFPIVCCRELRSLIVFIYLAGTYGRSELELEKEDAAAHLRR